MVLSSMKIPSLRNVSFMVGFPPIESFECQWYDVRAIMLGNCDACIKLL